MGDVAIKLKVMPESTETDLDAIDEAIRDAIDVESIEREEVAFGLKALMVTTVVADDEGGTDAIENALSGIDDVRSVEVTDLNRL